VLCEIVTLIKEIDEHRRIGAWKAPSLVAGISCTTRLRCGNGWEVAWADVLGGQMLHPRHPISDAEVLSALQRADGLPDVCYSCTRATHLKLQTKAVYKMEQYYFQRCVCNILGLSPPGKQTVNVMHYF
jgi:hypothetical protein